MPLDLEILEKNLGLNPPHATDLASNFYGDNSRLEQMLGQPEANYRSIFENAVIGIFRATFDGYYMIANSMLAGIYGYQSPAELVGTIRDIKELYTDPQRYAEWVLLLQEQKVVSRFEAEVYRQDGSRIWISQTARVISDQSGQLIGYEGTVEDITERKQSETKLEMALAQAQQLCDVKSKFASMVSHEFRSALTVILATSDLLKLHSKKMTDEQRIKYLNKIGGTVKNMTEMLEGVMLIGKNGIERKTTHQKHIDIASLCEDICQDVQTISKATHQLNFSSQCDRLTLIADPTLLKQIFMNLLLNAIKYSPQDSTVHFNLSCQSKQIVCTVKDEGIGIPEEDQEHIFEIFHRAKNACNLSGTGLGLTIVKSAVELLSGNIFVESKVGFGTTFTVTLPTLYSEIEATQSENMTFCVCDQI